MTPKRSDRNHCCERDAASSVETFALSENKLSIIRNRRSSCVTVAGGETRGSCRPRVVIDNEKLGEATSRDIALPLFPGDCHCRHCPGDPVNKSPWRNGAPIVGTGEIIKKRKKKEKETEMPRRRRRLRRRRAGKARATHRWNSLAPFHRHRRCCQSSVIEPELGPLLVLGSPSSSPTSPAPPRPGPSGRAVLPLVTARLCQSPIARAG